MNEILLIKIIIKENLKRRSINRRSRGEKMDLLKKRRQRKDYKESI